MHRLPAGISSTAVGALGLATEERDRSGMPERGAAGDGFRVSPPALMSMKKG
jgi:hypothetical protein